MKVFVVYDSAAAAYGPLMLYTSPGQAVREFSDAASDSKTQISKHPSDYTLFEIASYDQISGNIEMLPAHKSYGKALEYIASGSQMSL